MNQTHITLRLPDDLAKSLVRWARTRRLPKSQVVREAVAAYLTGAPARIQPRSVVARDLAARWPDFPRLTPEEAATLSADIEASRAVLPQLPLPWE